ncbi:MAG: putative enoyl-CoA hydratase [Acidimicrobiia bacterium]|nr:putative enoyl-CoA hydratase [Acidimicrobiia bacterium]
MSEEAVLGNTVLHRVENGISHITLNRPDAANAILAEMRNLIIDLMGEADADPSIRAVALRSNGRHFCSGADVGGIAAASAQPPVVGDGMRRIMQGAQRLVASILDCGKPVVGVVQGPAAGLGAHIAYACDMVVAADTAFFLEPFLLRGIIVDAGGAYLLPRLIGMQRAKELAFLGEKLSAADAKDLGLVNRVAPADQLDKVADELLIRLAGLPTTAVALTKRLFNRSFDGDRSASFLQEAMSQEMQSKSFDATEGIKAFMERRPTEFQGR